MEHIYPYSFQIELTEGCNRLCYFCGLWSIWNNSKERKFKFMTTDLAYQLSKSLNYWLDRGKRIEFAMHGEPLLNPNVIDIISIFRNNYKKAQYQLTTNGETLLKNNIIDNLFDAGLNILVIDTYDNSYDIFAKFLKDTKYPVIDYYNNLTGINIYSYNSNKLKVIFLVDDISKHNKKKRQRVILNHAGNCNPDVMPPTQYPLTKKCSRVYREMDFHYDGTVPICCIDWRHEFIIGKFPEENIEDIWNKQMWQIIRFLLYNKKRYIRPCYTCDYDGGFRLGFLEPIVMNLNEKTINQKIINHLDEYEKYMHKNGRKERFYNPNNKLF